MRIRTGLTSARESKKYTTDAALAGKDPFFLEKLLVPSVQSGEAFLKAVFLQEGGYGSSSRVFIRGGRQPPPEASYDNNDWLPTDLQAENLAGSTLVL